MPESPNNLRFFCYEHGPKPDPKLAKKPPEQFVGHYVKKAFATEVPGVFEHMWVHVQEVVDGTLRGILDNEPIRDCGVSYGDTVTVVLEEIEDALF